MSEGIKIKEDVIKLLIELSKDSFPKQYICKLLRSDDVIEEISILSNLEKNIPEIKPPEWTLVSAFSYGPYLDQFAVSPDVIFEPDFIGFAISHTDETSTPTENDKQLFAHRGDVHIIIAYPFDDHSWIAYDNNGNKINLGIIK